MTPSPRVLGRNTALELRKAAETMDQLVAALEGVVSKHGCGSTIEPCGECASSRALMPQARSQAADLMEMYLAKMRDAASHTVLSRFTGK